MIRMMDERLSNKIINWEVGEKEEEWNLGNLEWMGWKEVWCEEDSWNAVETEDCYEVKE